MQTYHSGRCIGSLKICDPSASTSPSRGLVGAAMVAARLQRKGPLLACVPLCRFQKYPVRPSTLKSQPFHVTSNVCSTCMNADASIQLPGIARRMGLLIQIEHRHVSRTAVKSKRNLSAILCAAQESGQGLLSVSRFFSTQPIPPKPYTLNRSFRFLFHYHYILLL